MEKRRRHIIGAILIIWIAFFITDFSLARNNKLPVFAIPVIRHKDGGSTEFYGLGYKVIKYVNLTVERGPEVENVVIGTWLMRFSPVQATTGTWGINLTTENITPTGLTLLFNQSGGNPKGDLQTGSMYWLEVQIDNQWVSVEMLPSEYDIGWTAEAYIIAMNDTTEWEVNWEWLYGELPEGSYRIGKEIMDFKGTGSYDISHYYAYFEIPK